MNDTREFLIAPVTTSGGLTQESLTEGALKVTREQIDEAAEQAREIADVMLARLRGAADDISEVTLEFGLSFEGKAGIPLITEAKAGATFAITVKWKFGPDSTG